jgi:tetraacyldisaccharide 4'-kinase
MEQALQRAWLRRGPLACALWPLSLLFGTLASLRRGAYRAGVFRSVKIPVPVIVVGNVVAGGSGKTPVVQALARRFLQQGIAVGIVSRGYGRNTSDCREVRPDSNASDTGDEPLLLALTTGAPVFVAPRRADAARALLDAHPQTRVILCDDGLQHYALERDIEVCVFDARGIGNGWLLPAGPLREAWPRKADFVLRAPSTASIGGFVVNRKLAQHALRSDGTRIDLASLRAQPWSAVAGIANPQAFFAMLRGLGIELQHARAFPDHHDFSDAAVLPSGNLLCTEKDAVKLWRSRPDALAVPLDIDIDAAFWNALDRALDAKLSSRDGPQTA